MSQPHTMALQSGTPVPKREAHKTYGYKYQCGFHLTLLHESLVEI